MKILKMLLNSGREVFSLPLQLCLGLKLMHSQHISEIQRNARRKKLSTFVTRSNEWVQSQESPGDDLRMQW